MICNALLNVKKSPGCVTCIRLIIFQNNTTHGKRFSTLRGDMGWLAVVETIISLWDQKQKGGYMVRGEKSRIWGSMKRQSEKWSYANLTVRGQKKERGGL